MSYSEQLKILKSLPKEFLGGQDGGDGLKFLRDGLSDHILGNEFSSFPGAVIYSIKDSWGFNTFCIKKLKDGTISDFDKELFLKQAPLWEETKNGAFNFFKNFKTYKEHLIDQAKRDAGGDDEKIVNTILEIFPKAAALQKITEHIQLLCAPPNSFQDMDCAAIDEAFHELFALTGMKDRILLGDIINYLDIPDLDEALELAKKSPPKKD